MGLGSADQICWLKPDIAFDEDHERVREDNGPTNFEILRLIALNLLKQEKTVTVAIKAQRLKAGWGEP